MSEIRLQAPAKINLVLAVGPQRADGYHDLVTVFHAIDLYDQLTISPSQSDISLTMDGMGAAELPCDERNLVVRAAKLLRDRFGTPDMGAQIHVDKLIPVAGGMAGGSADAAATLVGCAQAWGLDLGAQDLLQLAAELGSDVPFAMIGGNAIGQGRGERLQPLPAETPLHWALVTSQAGLSTPEVFARFDELGAATELSLRQDFVAAMSDGDLDRIAAGLRNDLQAAAIDLMPQLAATLAAAEQFGALAGLVSGSGPTCAFLCASAEDAQHVAERMAEIPLVQGAHTATGPVPGPLADGLR